jgi:hypothetical protein
MPISSRGKVRQNVKRDPKLTTSGVIVVNQSYDKDIHARLEKYRKVHGLLSIQEVDRLAVVFFLTKNGY